MPLSSKKNITSLAQLAVFVIKLFLNNKSSFRSLLSPGWSLLFGYTSVATTVTIIADIKFVLTLFRIDSYVLCTYRVDLLPRDKTRLVDLVVQV